MNPLLFRVFYDEKGKITSQILDMGACKSVTAEALFDNTYSIPRSTGMEWTSCVTIDQGC